MAEASGACEGEERVGPRCFSSVIPKTSPYSIQRTLYGSEEAFRERNPYAIALRAGGRETDFLTDYTLPSRSVPWPVQQAFEPHFDPLHGTLLQEVAEHFHLVRTQKHEHAACTPPTVTDFARFHELSTSI
jgi:hypothetical protein